MTVEMTDDREIHKATDKNFSDVQKDTQNAVLTTSQLPSVHHVPFNHDFGKPVAARGEGDHSITRISVGWGRGENLGATTCNRRWDTLCCCEDVTSYGIHSVDVRSKG
jgi:hypothetical protein